MEADATPWDRLLVDIIDLYKVRREGQDISLILNDLTTVDPATGWFKILK